MNALLSSARVCQTGFYRYALKNKDLHAIRRGAFCSVRQCTANCSVAECNVCDGRHDGIQWTVLRACFIHGAGPKSKSPSASLRAGFRLRPRPRQKQARKTKSWPSLDDTIYETSCRRSGIRYPSRNEWRNSVGYWLQAYSSSCSCFLSRRRIDVGCMPSMRAAWVLLFPVAASTSLMYRSSNSRRVTN
jgi:hypothetical protein